MTVSEQEQNYLGGFFAAIASLDDAYRHDSFAYVAVKQGDTFVLVQGILNLNVMPIQAPFAQFRSPNIRAGLYCFADLKLTRQQFVEALLAGVLPTPDGDLQFPADQGGRRPLYHEPLQFFALQNQTRINTLSISGAQQSSYIQQFALDWELRAAPTPYDSLQELMFEYRLGALRNNTINVEVVASNVAAVDAMSKLDGEKARLIVSLAHGLQTNKATLGYRVLSQGQVAERGMIEGRDLIWTDAGGYRHGTAEIAVPKGALIQCIASYAGFAQHYYWLVDLTTVQNARRAAYETYDRQLEKLREILSREHYRGNDARDFESAVAWLLWMLGFSVAHLSGSRGSDAPDLIAATSNGHIAVVECTTGLLKTDNKLPQLYERAQAMRRNLDASGNNHVRVLPVIVTAKRKSDITAELAPAEEHGILVLTRESVESALSRSLALPNADQLYEEAEQVVQAGQKLRKEQGNLPFQS